MYYDYSESELKRLLHSMVVLIDTREQENSHIISYLEKKKIEYQKYKLDFGDYSFMIPANSDLGIIRDMYFANDIVVERKASLQELSGNLTQDRQRFESELLRSRKAKLFLMIENASYSDIVGHKYSTQYDPKAFIATLKTYEARYGVNINFLSSVCAGNFIYHTFYYHLREYLKGDEAVG